MDAAEHPAGGKAGGRRTRDIGAQRVAHREHARDAQGPQHHRIDRRIGLAEIAHGAAHRLVAACERTGAEHAAAVADHLEVGVGADHRQVACGAGGQRSLVGAKLGGAERVVGSGVDDERRLRRRRHAGQRQVLDDAAVAFRAEMEGTVAERAQPGIRPVAQRQPGRLAAGQDRVVEGVLDAHGAHCRLDHMVAPRPVGEQSAPLAGRPEPREAIDRARVGSHAVVDHAPEVEDEAVIARGERREAAEMFYHCNSVPIAEGTSRSRAASSAASNSRLMRGISAGPA